MRTSFASFAVRRIQHAILLGLIALSLAGCGAGPMPLAGDLPRVVATTSIIGDVVANVGGDAVQLTVLMRPGVDPHTYTPTPKDTAAVHDADIVFINGAGLEAFLEELLQNAGGSAEIVDLSQGIELAPAAGEEHGEDDHAHGYDPHIWMSVPNVLHWVDLIEEALTVEAPDYADVYAANAEAYRAELRALDAWIRERIAEVPAGRRKLVTNHPAFGYFARTYGLEQVGAIYPVSPAAEPSAQDIALLEEAIREFGVPAVFTETSVNPKLAEQVARDTGVRLVPLYTGSLGPAGSEADTYIKMMRYNVNAMVEALAP